MVVLRNNFFSATAPNNAHYTNFVYVFVSHGTRTQKKETKQGKTGRQDIRNAFYQHLFDTSNAYTNSSIISSTWVLYTDKEASLKGNAQFSQNCIVVPCVYHHKNIIAKVRQGKNISQCQISMIFLFWQALVESYK